MCGLCELMCGLCELMCGLCELMCGLCELMGGLCELMCGLCIGSGLLEHHFHRLCSLALVAWGVLAPSYISAPIFVLGALTMATKSTWFSVVAPWVVVYSMLAVTAQYTAMLGGEAWWGDESSLTKHIGMVIFKTPVISLGAQFGITLFVATYVRKMKRFSTDAPLAYSGSAPVSDQHTLACSQRRIQHSTLAASIDTVAIGTGSVATVALLAPVVATITIAHIVRPCAF